MVRLSFNINSYLISLNNVYALIPSYMEKYAGNNEKTFRPTLWSG